VNDATHATFRFHAELNAFLPAARRDREFSCTCARSATAKHMIEALGVPHTEVALVLVNGAAASLAHRICDGERLDVYPAEAARELGQLAGGPREQDMPTRFIADVHLAGLARLLRLAGFDTMCEKHLGDEEIVAIALREDRCVLSRDVELLKRRNVRSGCYVHALKPAGQFREIVRRLELAERIRPFSLCMVCNTPLHAASRAEVLETLPASVREQYQDFTRCERCGRVYWQGSHWRRMQQMLAAADV
jgi:hypothetical protein